MNETYFDPNPKSLSEADKNTYADMYIGEMETRWTDGKPYDNAITLIRDVRKEARCSLKDAKDIVDRIAEKHRGRLEAMMYEFHTDKHFFLPKDKIAQIKRDAGVQETK